MPFLFAQSAAVVRDDAKVWILRNQLARRNLLDYQRGVLAIKLASILKPKAKERQRRHGQTAPGRRKTLLTKSTKVKPIIYQDDAVVDGVHRRMTAGDTVHVRKEVAKVAHLSEDTIRKVKVIEQKATPEQKQRLVD